MAEPTPGAPRKKRSGKLSVVVLVLLIIILAAVLVGLWKWQPGAAGITGGSDTFHAVFLTNGQVYFGHLDAFGTANPTLNEIYYLQLRRPLQEQKKEEGEGQTPQEQPELTLVKLGNELHGPVDKMTINKDHILFVEELKEDSKVVKAIEEYRNSQQ